MKQRKKKKNATCSPRLSRREENRARSRCRANGRGGGIRFTKAADLRCLAFVFARSASFVPRRIFCVSNAKLQPSFEEITPVRSIVFLLQSGPLFFYLFLLSPASYGKRLQPDPHETILALHSVRLLHERANEAVLRVIKGGKVSKPRIQ